MMQAQEELVVIKGKRTKRPRPPSPPLGLGPISNMPSSTSNCSAGTSSTNNSGGLIDVATSTTTTSNELRDRAELEDEDMAYCLILLAQGHHHNTHKASPSSQHVAAPTTHDHNDNNNKSSPSGLYLYQCKTCNKCFPSFQALGGHRASHKKPNNKTKGAYYGIEEKQQGVASFVNELDDDHDHCDPTTASTILTLQLSSNRPNLHGTSNTTRSTASATAKSKVHECSICGAGFSSGQALGGHMRRHRNFMSTSTTTITTSMSGGNIIGGSPESQEAKKPRNALKLDLNLPAPEDDHRESKFSFQTKDNVIVFSASSLVDCHY